MLAILFMSFCCRLFSFLAGSNPKIERAYLDGSGRKVVVGEGIHWPNGITLDYPTETLYWVDAKQHVIEAAHINGSHRRLVRHP